MRLNIGERLVVYRILNSDIKYYLTKKYYTHSGGCVHMDDYQLISR